MAVDFDDSAVGALTPAPAASSNTAPSVVEPPASSPAVERFRSCRWRKPAEDNEPECCTHRDVLPITGMHGFDPEAWCPDCAFFKLRRTPRKNNNH